MKLLKILLMAALLTAFVSSSLVFAEKKGQPSEAEIMQKWQAYAAPGPEHEGFTYFHGSWHIDSTSYMNPDKPEKEHMHGKAAPVLGGRYYVSTVEGKAMGMPFSGKLILGYDNNLKKYKGIWIDNMGTGMLTMEGEPMGADKEMVLKSIYKCPITGDDVTMRTVTKIIDQNKYTFKIYEKGGMNGPKERLTMDMTYVRHQHGQKYH